LIIRRSKLSRRVAPLSPKGRERCVLPLSFGEGPAQPGERCFCRGHNIFPLTGIVFCSINVLSRILKEGTMCTKSPHRSADSKARKRRRDLPSKGGNPQQASLFCQEGVPQWTGRNREASTGLTRPASARAVWAVRDKILAFRDGPQGLPVPSDRWSQGMHPGDSPSSFQERSSVSDVRVELSPPIVFCRADGREACMR
jgi:hypothetical protein